MAEDNQELEIDLDSELVETTLEDEPLVEDVLTEGETESEVETVEGEAEEPTEEPSEEPLEDEPKNPIALQRKHIRELEKQLKIEKLERERIERQMQTASAQVVETLPAKPTLEAHNYDEQAYETDLEQWYAKKSKIEQQQEQVKAREAEIVAKYNTKLQAYHQSKVAYKGINEAENVVTSTLDTTKQNVIINYAENPALVVYALGKNPVLLNKVANITDPYEYVLQIKEIERKATEMVKTKKTPPPPEKIVTGKSAVTSNHEKYLDKLRAEGKITEAIAYRRKHGLL